MLSDAQSYQQHHNWDMTSSPQQRARTIAIDWSAPRPGTSAYPQLQIDKAHSFQPDSPCDSNFYKNVDLFSILKQEERRQKAYRVAWRKKAIERGSLPKPIPPVPV